MKKVFIVSARRTPVGAFLGALSATHASDMSAAVIKPLLADAGVSPEQVDELICGNILSAGLGQGIARQAAVKAGIPVSVCAYSVNMLCGSGMKAVMNAATSIAAGEADIIVAGGVENMSAAPYLLPKEARKGLRMGAFQVEDHLIKDALTDVFGNVHMGITAENIADKHGITREAQDAFAWASQEKAIKAVDEGLFDAENVPLEVKVGREMVPFARDEYPNRKTSPDKLAGLRPAFRKEGSVTAGNASGINDGAAFLLLAGEDTVKKLNLKPLAEIVAAGQAGVDPSVMGLGPVPAIRKALKKAGLRLQDMELIELNEAFAAQSLGVLRELSQEHGMSEDAIQARTNLFGGAIALGHPVGASGARILVTLLHGLKREGKKTGLASLCIGGGMGTAVIVKTV
ncbi:MAG: acetyl-CoA C-acetyltransferase [Eubacteriales bacterium]|nr:acetyl-CoA C-acetyltransferase [Eubacteriales bacterium]MDD3109390.1 acetyl-CoA C-acetyltransferase [Eubacteriales bacterium]MDD4133970.1 acetyl-CoA C-acetyltransferase [Eubacteriales bacterium]